MAHLLLSGNVLTWSASPLWQGVPRRLNFEPKMVSKTDFTIGSMETGRRQEAESRLDKLMDELIGGRIAARITEAARLATARHIYLSVQELPTAVEAENST